MSAIESGSVMESTVSPARETQTRSVLDQASSCTACGLHETCVTVGIGSRGRGKIMLVGEAPGGHEDMEGLPFVGRAGKMLETMVSNASLGDVVLTNAVRCRPPQNRKPTSGEIKACRQYLEAEIAELSPEVIVALGDTALQALTGRSGVKKYRSQELALHKSFGRSVPVYCTYHPAFVLRQPNMQSTVEADFRRVRDRNLAEVDVTWGWGTFPTKPFDLIAWDIETDYNFQTREGGDRPIQIAYATDSEVVVSAHEGAIGGATMGLRKPGTTRITHNGWKFDVPVMRAAGHDVPMGEDTMPLAYLDDENQPLSLESLCVKYLGVKGWKDGIHATPGSGEFALYNARDAKYTLLLYKELRRHLGERMRLYSHVIRPAFLALQECSRRGIYIDRDAVAKAREIFRERAIETMYKTRELGGIVNPSSSRQVAIALEAEGHRLPLTETGQASTGAAVLASLEQTPLVLALREHRKAVKAITAFIVPYERALESPDQRVHPEYTLWRTVTGRSSARNPNVQQLPRDPLLRSFFAAPPGYELVQADYAAIEFRLAAFVAGERSILDRYVENSQWDPHRWFAALLYNKPLGDVTSQERQIAKSANFGLLYMAQWFTLQEYTLKTTGVELTQKRCQEIVALWHETFPSFREWYRLTAMNLRAQGYVESLTGRRRHYGDPLVVRSQPRAVFEGFLRESVNFQVQSLGADVAFLGLSAAYRGGLPINGFFHDAITFELPVGLTPLRLEDIRRAMVEGPVLALREHFDIDLTVPLVIEVKTKEKTCLV